MKFFYTLLIGLLIASQNLSAQIDKEKVWELILQLDNAITNKDSNKLKQILTAGFIGVIPTGEMFTKNNYISYHIKPGGGLTVLTGHDINNATIRVSPTIAIVNRRVHAKIKTPDGSENEFDVQRIEVCLKKMAVGLLPVDKVQELTTKGSLRRQPLNNFPLINIRSS